ncbi:MAG TPA: PTS sugar transporter subunit IIC [Gemmatimonadales bacterium]|nr:PTS sugar transporter subunit IIC [Gemmatimonadales bacterium]
MSEFAPELVLPLLLWGTLVGLDLVSVPQAMISRPVVAGSVAGALVNDVEVGLRIGVLFELFALDVLPAGAVRYPDYGPATVSAVALGAGTPEAWELDLGLSTALGLVIAVVGGWSLQVVRRWNARSIQRRAAALAAGESSAIRRLQYGGILRDSLRGFVLTLTGLVLASTIVDSVRLDRQSAVAFTLVAIGSALAAAVSGAFRGSGRGPRLKWLIAGAVVGTTIAVFA